jgi:hypothetical protein
LDKPVASSVSSREANMKRIIALALPLGPAMALPAAARRPTALAALTSAWAARRRRPPMSRHRLSTFRPEFEYMFQPNAQSNIRNAAVFGFKAHVEF